MCEKPAACAGVAAGNDDSNHARVAGEKWCSSVSVATAEEYPVGASIGTLSAMPTAGEHHPAFEEYCECIYEMREDNAEIIQARLAERLNVSRASVSEMVKRMEAAGLIRLDAAQVLLTPAGELLAERIVRRHRLAERFLTDVIGLPWAQAHHEACKWEHVISDEVEEGLVRLLGNPSTCPHGNPIPGTQTNIDTDTVFTTPLADVNVGDTFTVVRIPEDVEEHDGALQTLERHRVIPGRRCTLAERRRSGDRIVVHDTDDLEVTLDPFISARLLVTV